MLRNGVILIAFCFTLFIAGAWPVVQSLKNTIAQNSIATDSTIQQNSPPAFVDSTIENSLPDENGDEDYGYEQIEDQKVSESPNTYVANTNITDTTVRWLSIEQALTLQQKAPKKIFIEVYASWCKWCKAMEAVYKHPAIASYLNAEFYPVRLNCESREEIIFKNEKFKLKYTDNGPVHELALYLLNNKETYPGHVIFNEELNLITTRTGYMDTILTENVLYYYGTNAFKELSFTEFEQQFNGHTH